MSRYRRRFPGGHTVFPVIHVESVEQACRNAAVARDCGADGVFLIRHGESDRPLLEVHAAVVRRQPDWWVGLNCLEWSPEETFAAISPQVSGVWVDNAGIEESREEQPYADRVNAARQARVPDCLYFGGVAFKYQRSVDDLEAACLRAVGRMDVVITSGLGTGHAADVDKIRRMKRALGTHPLAIASGITPENIADYLPHADSFLVATGIGRTFTELDPVRTRGLIDRVRAYSA